MGVQRRILFVSNVGLAVLHSSLYGVQITLRDLPFQLGHVASSRELPERALELKRILANLLLDAIFRFCRQHGVSLSFLSLRLLHGVKEGESDIQTDREIIGRIVLEIIIVVVELCQVGILRSKVGNRHFGSLLFTLRS